MGNALASGRSRLRRAAPYAAVTALVVAVALVASLTASRPAPRIERVAAASSSNEQGGSLAEVVNGDAGAGAQNAAGALTGGGTSTKVGAGGSRSVSSARHGTYDDGVDDNTIRVGGSTFTSGPAAVYGEQIAVGFAAGVNYVNEHGGINGRKVLLKIYDDGADPAKQLANTKRLVEVDHVFALSMVYADIAGQYVAQKGIPVYHLGQNNAEFTNPWWFPVGGPQRLASYWMASFGYKTLGVRKVAVFYLDVGAVNYSRAYADQVASDWKAYGADVPVEVGFAVDQTSCSDAVSQARNAGVDFIQFELDAGHVINCGVEAQVEQYKPSKGWGGYLIGVPVIHEALGDYSIGMYAFDAFGANYNVADYKNAVREVSQKTESYSSVTASYFISALLMRDSIAKLGDNITRVRLRDVLNTFRDWRPGLTNDANQPSWTWTPQCHVALNGGYVIQIRKQPDGSLKWEQITPQFTSTPVPPGQTPPRDYAGCDIFSKS